jgi:hypothetical protein
MYMTGTSLRLYAQTLAAGHKNAWDVPAILMQKFPADRFMATTRLTFHGLQEGDRTGLLAMGSDYAGLTLTKTAGGLRLDYITCHHADEGAPAKALLLAREADSTMYLRVTVEQNAVCQFSYSTDGTHYKTAGSPFQAAPGRWIGAKLGIFCSDTMRSHDSGYADFDWFRVEPAK